MTLMLQKKKKNVLSNQMLSRISMSLPLPIGIGNYKTRSTIPGKINLQSVYLVSGCWTKMYWL